jgi:hypothetical protein
MYQRHAIYRSLVMKATLTIIITLVLIATILFFVLRKPEEVISTDQEQEVVTELLETVEDTDLGVDDSQNTAPVSEVLTETSSTYTSSVALRSDVPVQITDGVRHTIDPSEIMGGGPAKDGIPSIDDPEFISVKEARKIYEDDAIGLTYTHSGITRFYPYAILVWHEIVNDRFGDIPVLVTYCPLCQTGVVFDPVIGGTEYEFGTSGKLWRSNLVMYNRTGNPDTETYWSQVLGEGIVGPLAGKRLSILGSDTILFGDWRDSNPEGQVLDQPGGFLRDYTRDPYGGYYTSDLVSYGATFDDDRLHQKTIVIGIEIDGAFKAYDREQLPVGVTEDTFAGKELSIQKNADGTIVVQADGSDLAFINGFWFSWLAVHADTELWVK